MKQIAVMITLFLSLIALPLAAQEAPSAEQLEQRVRDLERRVAELKTTDANAADIAEIRRQIDILTQEIEALKVERRPALADKEEYGLGAAASKVYRVDEGISLGGYGEFLYENYASENDRGNDAGKTDQLDVLRAILYVGYKFSDNIIFNSEIEFEHGSTGGGVGEVSVEFAYVDFLINPAFNVRAGQMLMPVGLINELHEPTAFLGAIRPAVERQIIPSTWRDPGVGIFGEFGDFAYRSYIVTGLNARKFSASGIRSGRQQGAKAKAEDFAWVGRLDYQPLEGVLLGASLYTGGAGQGLTTPGGEEVDASVTLAEVHADVRMRGLWLRALWADGSIDDVADLNLARGLTGANSVGEEFSGWYAELGYDFAPLFLPRAQSLTPFIRYESFDTQESVPAGFAINPALDNDILTTGVAWKPIPQIVIKGEYQNVDNEAGTGVDQFNLALGYIF